MYFYAGLHFVSEILNELELKQKNTSDPKVVTRSLCLRSHKGKSVLAMMGEIAKVVYFKTF